MPAGLFSLSPSSSRNSPDINCYWLAHMPKPVIATPMVQHWVICSPLSGRQSQPHQNCVDGDGRSGFPKENQGTITRRRDDGCWAAETDVHHIGEMKLEHQELYCKGQHGKTYLLTKDKHIKNNDEAREVNLMMFVKIFINTLPSTQQLHFQESILYKCLYTYTPWCSLQCYLHH